MPLDGSVDFCEMLWLEGGNFDVSPKADLRTCRQQIGSSCTHSRLKANTYFTNLPSADRDYIDRHPTV